MKILVTGAAGFIGFHLADRLLKKGHYVVGLDNLNEYYDVNLKLARLELLRAQKNFSFVKGDIADKNVVAEVFKNANFDRVIHMAAQAGVRYSKENPHVYVQSNLVGFVNILESCRHAKTPHLVYASSSSVYGLNTKLPFSTSDNVDHPISLYAATKKSNELMAHTYSYLYGLPTTGLRFFTVYGPWNRPDMALFKFAKAIYEETPIDVYGKGDMNRDFTYVDDIVTGVLAVSEKIPTADITYKIDKPSQSVAPYKLYNIGNNAPVNLLDFIRAIESVVGKKAKLNLLPMEACDVKETLADVDDLMRDINFVPAMRIEDGVQKFWNWYKEFYCL